MACWNIFKVLSHRIDTRLLCLSNQEYHNNCSDKHYLMNLTPRDLRLDLLIFKIWVLYDFLNVKLTIFK